MSSLTRTETARWLLDHDNYLILTHRRPDGDTLGSAAFLCRGLRQLGKTAHILRNPEITEKYASLHCGLTVSQPEDAHTVICVDTASPGMLAEAFLPLQSRIALRIDHHGTATTFTPLELVDPDAAACGDVLYDVLTEMGATLDKDMAEALYTAVSTDTGCFRYANTNEHSYLVAAACAKAGGDLFSLNQALFETNSLGRLRLQGWLIDNAVFLQEGKAVICALPLSQEKAMGLTEDDMENISGFPRSIAGVKLAATLRQEQSGLIKLSVRAVPGYDAAAICAMFGGGGHKGAAGASMNTTMDEAVLAVKTAFEAISM